MVGTLEPLSPRDSVEWYLEHKENEVTRATVDSYRTSLYRFVEYCQDSGFSNINNLSGRDIERYRIWRREDSTDGRLRPKSMRDQMYLLRDFLRYLGSIEAVPSDLHERVVVPKLGPGDGISDVTLERERAREILNYLNTYEYASLDHVLWLLLCETGRRVGGLQSLDVQDFYPEADNPYLAFRHRPRRGTRLKNGANGETNVNISGKVCSVVSDYLENKRPTIEDAYGRKPLLATDRGRMSTSTMRKYVYRWTRPCVTGHGCPHDKKVADCSAAQHAHQASKCPSTVSPHAIRHGYISAMLDSETPKQILSERCDVSEPVIDDHYDERSEAEKQDLRKRILERICQNDQPGYLR